MEVCSIGERVYLGHKEGNSTQLEVDSVLMNVDGKVLVHREEEDREEVVSQGRDMEDIGEFNLLGRFTIDHRLKQDSPYTL